MITIAQIGGILFCVIMILVTYVGYRKKKLLFSSVLFWSILWVGLIIGILLFDQIRGYTQQINVAPFDFFVLVAVGIIFLILFNLSNQMKANQKNIEEMVASFAMFQAKQKKKK